MRIVRFLAFIGLAISGTLLLMKLTGSISSIRGCGGSGGCENVLGSKWSQWFGIPVSAFSTLLYGGLIVVGFRWPSAKMVFKAIAVLLLLAAFWFVGLQIFALRSFCPWCCATHLVGLLTSVALLRTISQQQRSLSTGLATTVAVVLFLGMVLGQVFGPEPDSHEVLESQAFVQDPKAKAVASEIIERSHKKKSDRVISFQGGAKKYLVSDYPILGSPDAPHILVKYFDYTCASCRDTEGDLEALMKKHPGDIAVLVLPSPIHRKCNPYLKAQIPDHEHACELARLGLAAWRASPEQFEKVHHLLFSRPVVGFEEARQKLGQLIALDQLDAALKDPWVEKKLKANIEDFRLLTQNNPAMPKVLITGSRLLQGTARSTEIFVRELEKLLELE